MGHPFEFFAGEINFENLTKLENKKNGPSHNVPLIVFHIFLNCHRDWLVLQSVSIFILLEVRL